MYALDEPVERLREVAPQAAAVTEAPGAAQIKLVRGLADSLLYANRNERELNLLKGIYYVVLKRQYEDYKAECYAAGIRRKEGMLSYPEFKNQYGYKLDKPGWISELTQVAARFCFSYGLIDYEIVTREDRPDLDWQDGIVMSDQAGYKLTDEHGELRYEPGFQPETVRISLTRVHPLLLALPHERLYDTLAYHRDPQRALEILSRAAKAVSRDDFDRWLIEELTIEDKDELDEDERELADMTPEDEPTVPYVDKVRRAVSSDMLRDGMRWDTILADFQMPIGALTGDVEIEVKVKGKVVVVKDDPITAERVAPEQVARLTGQVD